jgi:hypothetical protein
VRGSCDGQVSNAVFRMWQQQFECNPGDLFVTNGIA